MESCRVAGKFILCVKYFYKNIGIVKSLNFLRFITTLRIEKYLLRWILSIEILSLDYYLFYCYHPRAKDVTKTVISISVDNSFFHGLR